VFVLVVFQNYHLLTLALLYNQLLILILDLMAMLMDFKTLRLHFSCPLPHDVDHFLCYHPTYVVIALPRPSAHMNGDDSVIGYYRASALAWMGCHLVL
jgi:hypothetical protein